ncbi:MAG: hypothetical protein COA94_01560 [Rickettsiales bacterium]|nr:MAG: hypothetical protein COA94_01560 [Rickettsiales bacterium]
MIRNLFSSACSAIKSFFSGLMQIPAWIRQQITCARGNFASLRRKLNDLTGSNMELGIYHLYEQNFYDAIFRFKMVDKFLKPGDAAANYWLGWVYLLRREHKKSIICLSKADKADEVGLLPFVKSIDSVSIIPDAICALHRDIIANKFTDKIPVGKVSTDKTNSKTENLPKSLVLALNEAITELPDKYSILELGSNIGLLSYEINKRMQESYDLTGVEASSRMINLQQEESYDKTIHSSVNSFLSKCSDQYDVIVSLEGLAFVAKLEDIFSKIHSILKPNGYFAFSIPVLDKNIFLDKSLEFAYNKPDIEHQLKKNGFNIVSISEINLEIKNNYSIFVCTKRI